MSAIISAESLTIISVGTVSGPLFGSASAAVAAAAAVGAVAVAVAGGYALAK